MVKSGRLGGKLVHIEPQEIEVGKTGAFRQQTHSSLNPL